MWVSWWARESSRWCVEAMLFGDIRYTHLRLEVGALAEDDSVCWDACQHKVLCPLLLHALPFVRPLFFPACYRPASSSGRSSGRRAGGLACSRLLCCLCFCFCCFLTWWRPCLEQEDNV